MSKIESENVRDNDSQQEETKNEIEKPLDHEELIKLTKQAIRTLIESDPFLKDLPQDPTIEEIRAQTAVVYGKAIQVYLDRGTLPRLAIVVPKDNTTVLELKKAIKRQTNLELKREGINKKISWKHVWKKYHLSYDDLRLTEENDLIVNYGIVNKSVLRYAKKRREKNRMKYI